MILIEGIKRKEMRGFMFKKIVGLFKNKQTEPMIPDYDPDIEFAEEEFDEFEDYEEEIDSRHYFY